MTNAQAQPTLLGIYAMPVQLAVEIVLQLLPVRAPVALQLFTLATQQREHVL